MGSKKHKKHSKGRDDEGPPLGDHAPPIKLVLKVGSGGASPLPGPTPVVSYSSTVSAPSPFQPNSNLNPGISVRLIGDNADGAVKKVENPIVNGSIASDSLSESSHHKLKKSEKKKKKKKKHHHHHCHHHKHHHSSQHGEKRKERGDDEDEDEEDDRPPKKQRHPITESIDNQTPLPEVPLRSPVGVILPKVSAEMSALQKLLNVLLELLRKKDTYDFFAWPVNDAIAPGYSTIISKPMDFSTMRRKLDNQQYRNLDSFRSDVRLICDNATTYNRPETIYYKEARKLWRNAQKILSKENILSLDPEMKSIGALTIEDLGFDLRSKSPIEELAPRVTRNRYRTDDDVPNVVPPMRISLAASVVEHCIAAVEPLATSAIREVPQRTAPESSTLEDRKESPVIERMHPDSIARSNIDTAGKQIRPGVKSEPSEDQGSLRAPSPGLARKSRPDESASEFRPPADDADPNEILEHSQRMARGAADRLSLLRPATTYSFLRQQEDGSTSLNILNPDLPLTDRYSGARPPEVPVPPKKVDLEMLIGKLPYGVSYLVDFKDEARSIAKPLNYLPIESVPPFSTYAPHYDSTFSNLTKAESDLVYSTYGDVIGVQYAESIMHFAKDCDYVMTMVDNILDLLSGGEHKKTISTLESGDLLRDIDETEEIPPEKCNGHSAPINNNSVVSSTSPAVSSTSQIRVTVVTPHQNGFANSNGSASLSNGDSNGNVSNDGAADSSAALPKSAENDPKLQSKLAETSEMIERLTKLQKDRLSQPPPTHLGSVQGPSPAELELADELAATLSELASHAKPGSIVSVDAIRRAMGITLPDKKTTT